MTLLEMLAALTILTMLLALAPVALNNITPRWSLRGGAHQVESLVLWAQNAAASRDRPVWIMYDVPEGTAWVEMEDEEFSFQRLPSKVRFVEVRFATGIDVKQDIAAVLVQPNMTLDPHSVTLTTTAGERAVLEFDRLTGNSAYREELHGAR
jgi:hypothetical protein